MRKILALLLFISSLAFSRDVVTGFCETGAQRVITQTVQSSTYVQRSNPSCTITVYNQGTLVKPTIFSTFAGAALTNPFTSAPDGYYFFWADSGQFDVVLSGSTIQAPVTREAAVASVAAGGLLASNNLSDVNNVATSRTNLGLGGAAVLNVGIIPGTVAAGDDSRFPTAGQAAALAGSAGVPSVSNKYITQADVATTTTANLIPRALASGLLSPGWLDYTGQYATAGQPGFLSAADWTAFNAKAAAGTYISALTGDMTATGPGSATATIAANAVTAAKFQQIATGTILGRNTAATGNVEILSTIPAAVQLNITQVGTLIAGSIPYSLLTGAPATVNAASDGVTKGVVTFVSTDFTCTAGQCLINYAGGQKATGAQPGFLTAADWSTFNNKAAAGNYITALTGNVTATGPGSAAATLVSIPSGVSQLGYLAITAIAAPATPGAGICRGYVDITSKNLACKNDAGIVNHGVQTQAAVTGQYLQAIDDTGTVHIAVPPAFVHIICTGTASSTATLFIKQYGSNACNNTTETINAGTEVLAEHNGFLQNLRVKSNTAGFAAGSGIVTLGITGTGDTLVTCTVGTGTTCNDATHSVAVTAGSRIYVKMVTAATETLADVLVTYEY